MPAAPALYFGSFRLDPRAQLLWEGPRAIRLTPKAYGVLDYLARHVDRIVPKHELLDHVWPEVHVGDAVLKVAIREIRSALGDDSAAPRFVQTARRIGYRFVARVSPSAPFDSAPSDDRARTFELASAPTVNVATTPLVGRDRALQALHSALVRTLAGQRQVVFVVGEGGIGKTSIVDTFLRQVERDARVWIAKGQCLEHAGGAEAYLPVLDALGRLARHPGRGRVTALLRQYAPTWLAQMPSLVEARDSLQHETFGATPERMLREIAEALEALTADTPLVLFLDDLHWSDDATVDFVGLMARRAGPSRLLLVLAYRPVDVALARPGLKTMKQELAAKGLSQDLPLDFLTPADAAALLDARFPGHRFPDGLATLLHHRTSGNPLFMINLLEYLAAQGMIAPDGDCWALTATLGAVSTASPETLQQVIEGQLARLSLEERSALEVASVCGIDCSAAAVAAGLGVDDEVAEAWLDSLARRGQFVLALELVELPSGWSPRYQFVHSLHQETLYRLLPPARRLRLHLRIAESLEQRYGAAADQVAGALAEHFEQARDYRRAITYLRMAAVNETRRFANREAAGWLDRALELVERLPPEERAPLRIVILSDLGRVRRSMGDMRGSSAAFLAAAATARQSGNPIATVEALLLAASALTWFDREACLAAAEDAERLAPAIHHDIVVYARGYSAYWYLLWGPWQAADAQDCEAALTLARASQDPLRLFSMLPRCAYVRLAEGRYAAAAAVAREGSTRALAANDAFGRMVCQFYGVWAELLQGSWGGADELLAESLQLAERNGHRSWEMLFAALRAWLLREAGAPAEARRAAWQAVQAARAFAVPFAELIAETQLGLAMLDLDDARGALEILEGLDARLEREPMLMAAAWRMPIHIGTSAAHRRLKAWTKAEDEAERARELAARSGERTWLALGWLASAELALDHGNQEQVRAAIDEALAAVGNGDAPTAAWRVHASAAAIAAADGQAERALDQRTRAAAVIRQLADSLIATSDLRRTFLDRPEVQAILASPAV